MTVVIDFPGTFEAPEHYAWELTAQGERRHVIPPEGIELSIEQKNSDGDYTRVKLIGGGYQDDQNDDFPLSKKIIREHAFRICPWAIIWCASGWYGSAYCGAKAWPWQGVALVKSCYSPYYSIKSAMHEVWHLLEEHIPEYVLKTLDEELSNGPKYGPEPKYGYFGQKEEYLSLAWERRARAFQYFAMMQIEGVGIPELRHDAPCSAAWRVMHQAWSGELGQIALQNKQRKEAAEKAKQKWIESQRVRFIPNNRRKAS